VKDFNYKSLHSKIEPLILAMSFTPLGNGEISIRSENWPPVLGTALIKIGPGSIKPVLEKMEAGWKEITGGEPFVFKFVDEDIQKQYEEEMRVGRIIDYSSVFALLIAVLGLFGLSTITAENRIKEVGIRKVLGANPAGIVTLMSKDLLILVTIANIIAWPMAFLLMTSWLENFAFRIDIGPGVFLIAGLSAIMIAFLTVSYNAVKAANSNPVESLRSE
jgi:putative ABC transport system permease protein